MNIRRLTTRLAVLAALALAVAAAFGAAPGSPAVAGPNCTLSAAEAGIDSAEQQMLDLINQHRADNGLGPLELSDTLNKASAWKSKHMADNSYFAHDDVPIGRSWIDRIRDCGYTYNTWIGENIAAGNEGASGTFQQWKNSPGHNANMLNAQYTAIGIGRAYNQSSPYDWYWTTDFGGVADGYTPAQTPTPPPPTSTPAPVGPAGVRMPGTAPDTDGDGCTDSRELGSDEGTGGQRDPNNFWDFFDVPDATNHYDGTISLSTDIFAVLSRFGENDSGGSAAINRTSDPLSQPPATGYHPAFDRSAAAAGGPQWQLGPPDGQVDLFTDIFGIALQFGHSCN